MKEKQNLIQLIQEQSENHFTTEESLKILKPTIGSNGKPVLVSAFELCINNLYVSLHLDHRSFLHPIDPQSSQEGIPLLFREANPQVNRKSRGQALNQAAG